MRGCRASVSDAVLLRLMANSYPLMAALRANAESLLYIVRMRTGCWPQMPSVVVPVCCCVGRENRRSFLPRITLMHANGCRRIGRSGLFVASPYATLTRLPVRGGVPGELRWPPFCERARSMESFLLACVRLRSLTKVPRGASSVEGMYRPRPKPPDRGRVVGCGSSLLGQAARCDGRPWRHSRRGTAQPWIRRRCHDNTNTHAPAPAFARIRVIRGKKPKTLPSQSRPRLHRSVRLRLFQTARLCDRPGGRPLPH